MNWSQKFSKLIEVLFYLNILYSKFKNVVLFLACCFYDDFSYFFLVLREGTCAFLFNRDVPDGQGMTGTGARVAH